MGIKSINQFLKDKEVECFIERYSLSNFSGHRIAIDAANWCYMFIAGEHKDTVYKTKNIIDDEVDREVTLQKMYHKFLNFNILLLQNNIIPVWCWDGVAHDEKGPEREKRKKARDERKTRIKDLKEKIEAVPFFLRNASNLGNVDEHLRIQAVECKAMEKELKSIISTQVFVTYEEMDIIRSIVEGLGIPSVQAEHEGEMLCAQLAVKGKVSAVWSSDTDNYAMGTPIMISGLNGYGPGKSSLVKIVSTQRILEKLELNQEQLREFCVMCGCDYNTNIKNYGPKKAYDLLKRYGSIDAIQKNLEGLDMTCLNHKVCIDYLTPKDLKISADTINVDIEKFNTQAKDVLHSFSLEGCYDDLKSGMEKVVPKAQIVFL